MPIAQPDLEAILREGFPDAEIRIEDLAGDGDHYKARIVSKAFTGLPRVRQHQLRRPEGQDGRRTARARP
jgi:stress-induced morphogen